jgi:hypothetical protein
MLFGDKSRGWYVGNEFTRLRPWVKLPLLGLITISWLKLASNSQVVEDAPGTAGAPLPVPHLRGPHAHLRLERGESMIHHT